jgi:hypothetical protein
VKGADGLGGVLGAPAWRDDLGELDWVFEPRIKAGMGVYLWNEG